MRIIDNVDEMTETARGWLAGGPVAFVPLTGTIHEGHKALIETAYEMSEVCVVSIIDRHLLFSAQASTSTLSVDHAPTIQQLRNTQADIIFIPQAQELYPTSFANYVMPTGPLADCIGKTTHSTGQPEKLRHFATTMLKLFQITRPDITILGQKNALEIGIINQLICDFNIDMKLHVQATIREDDGLAIGQRNQGLTPRQRRMAPLLYRALLNAKMLISAGERRTEQIEKAIASCFSHTPEITLEYIIICHAESFTPLPKVVPGTLIAVGIRIGDTPLIDNIQWNTTGDWFM